MELLQLRYFTALAQNQHLTKTAREMMVTPSAISSSLNRLETELGVKLFDRVGRSIRLNEYGAAFLPYARQVFSALDNAAAELKEMQSAGQAALSVGITNPNLWNNPLYAFRRAHPEVSVSLFSCDTGSHDAALTARDADFYIATTGALSGPGLAMQQLLDSRVLLAVSPRHPFAGRKEIDLAEAKDEWFVNSPHGSSFRRFCDELCLRAGFTPKSRVECDYVLRPKMLLNENMVCIATELGLRSNLYAGTVMIPIVRPVCSRPQAIYWHKNRYQTKAALAFKEFMVEYCLENFTGGSPEAAL